MILSPLLRIVGPFEAAKYEWAPDSVTAATGRKAAVVLWRARRYFQAMDKFILIRSSTRLL